MIQAKDLRLGNKVLNLTGEVITVQQIRQNTVVYNNYLQVDKEKAALCSSSVLSYTSRVVEVIEEEEYPNLNPIPLTKQLLESCGFRNFKREEWVLSFDRSHADFEFTAEGLMMREPAAFKRPIKYLHQLQNVFFALTGNELEMAQQPFFAPNQVNVGHVFVKVIG
jgi:hypothetical protein